MFKRANLKKITDRITLIDDAGSGTCYVLKGSDRALLIDTANGLEDLSEIVSTITNLPLIVVNTHCHPDHVGGNKYFDKAYMSAVDIKIYKDMLDFFTKKGIIDKSEYCPAEPIKEGDVIDLGDRKVEVIECPGHTPGCIALLDREDKILFTGDMVLDRMVWMQLDNCTKMSVYLSSLKHINTYRDKFDTLLTGHGMDKDSPELIDLLMTAAQAVIDGKTDHAGTFKWSGGEDKCYYYKPDCPLVYKDSVL